MKIATYNVWNDSESIGARFGQLMQEITRVDADIIALQEVTPAFYNQLLLQKLGYEHCVFNKYADKDEGLAVLSQFPFDRQEHLESLNCRAQNVLFQCGTSKFSLTNVHLPWDSVREKEKQIVAVDQYIHCQMSAADYLILLGDFNSGINSSVHRFLIGEQTIHGEESKPCWLDVMGTYHVLHGLPLPSTMDCRNNPRWKGKNTIYAPENCDRIYVLDNWKPMKFINAEIFGTAISPISKLSASDHYGVVVEVDFAGRA